MADRRMILALAGGLAGSVVLAGRPALAATVVDQVLGKADAPVEVIEYASLTCPHCANFHKTVLPALKTRYIDTGKVRLVYRDFPLDAIALKAAIVAHCAGPERYFQFLDALFATQASWAYAKDPILALKQTARIGGLPDPQLDACLADKAMEDGVLAARLKGQQDFKVRATPTIIVNGKTADGIGTIDDLAKLIDPLLK